MSTRAFSESSFMTEPKGYNKAEKGRNGVVTQRGGTGMKAWWEEREGNIKYCDNAQMYVCVHMCINFHFTYLI